ncbi:helicase-associated domain-containing protein [Leucobacter tenebrionis]|uniref:helicase-associated domain-containing protein n=1 Tax=Leucobacter tenebrionis TaxID=2873270 RepID=UPI001CA76490|nr:helicase-associated domain-containing protein [Leucobacter tenebrionis]QZY52949.1 helicase-associated domain-containing protein [Leucobacter tenebrionis]
MSGILALASAIAEMERPSLEALVRRRRVQSPANVLDPIGLATELLRPESIARTLADLDRPHLAALLRPDLLAGSAEVDELTGLGLLGVERHEGQGDDKDPVTLPEVDAVLRDALREVGIDPEALSDPATVSEDSSVPDAADPATDAATGSDDAASDRDGSWYAEALTAVAQAAECLRALQERPGRLNRSGTVAVAAVRALSETTSVDVADLTRTLTALGRAGLTRTAISEAALIPAAGARDWLGSSHTRRWLILAEAALAAMAPPLRASLQHRDGADLAGAAAALPSRFPLLPEAEFAAARSFVDDLEHLGLTAQGRLSDVGLMLLDGEFDAALSAVEQLFPGVSPGVYVQPDLSVVVPGPLSPDDEAIIASLTVPEHVGVASTRRITEASVTSALERGRTAAEAREDFERLSSTGIPQPLDYLLTSLAERLGSILVEENDGDEGRTRLVVARPDLAETLLVDRALQHLQLHRPAPGDPTSGRSEVPGATLLFSRLRIDHVLAALGDARYPATGRRAASPAAEAGSDVPSLERAGEGSGSGGVPETASAPPVPSAAARFEDGLPEPLAALVDRVFAAARSEPGTGDFTRRLELAIRDRSPVRVTAEARGQSHTFTLLPVSVTAGRLRASDQAAGVERTLPISTITAVDPA